MKELIFSNPVAVKQTTIHQGESFEHPAPDYYSRFLTVYTKYGIVTVLDFDWKTNSGNTSWTEFRTIIDGEIWNAELKESRLSDLRVKWMATNFIKTCIDAYNGVIMLVDRKNKSNRRLNDKTMPNKTE